jgi:hypothetical protein
VEIQPVHRRAPPVVKTDDMIPEADVVNNQTLLYADAHGGMLVAALRSCRPRPDAILAKSPHASQLDAVRSFERITGNAAELMALAAIYRLSAPVHGAQHHANPDQ